MNNLQRVKAKSRMPVFNEFGEIVEEGKQTDLVPHQDPELNRHFNQQHYENALQWASTGRRMSLSHHQLKGASLQTVDLAGAKLSVADLSLADLSLANLSETDLRMANLSGANLTGANLSKADLRKADLRNANLRKANLKGAKLKDANMKGVKYSINWAAGFSLMVTIGVILLMLLASANGGL